MSQSHNISSLFIIIYHTIYIHIIHKVICRIDDKKSQGSHLISCITIWNHNMKNYQHTTHILLEC